MDKALLEFLRYSGVQTSERPASLGIMFEEKSPYNRSQMLPRDFSSAVDGYGIDMSWGTQKKIRNQTKIRLYLPFSDRIWNQTEVSLVLNQSRNGKYDLILL